MSHIVIALGHKSRVGKDLGAKFLETWLRGTFKGKKIGRRSFADSLKQICNRLFLDCKDRYYYEANPEEKLRKLPCGLTPMELWIKFGTEWCRSIDPDVWARQLFWDNTNDITIVPDLRFPNEAETIRRTASKSILLKIDRTDAPVFDSVADKALDGWDGWDGVIYNNGTIVEYHQTIIAVIQRLLNGAI